MISGAKSDPGDAHVIAEYLRLRTHRLCAAPPLTEHTIALRAVSHTRTDLVAAWVAATNPLAALLDAHWPGAKEVFADVETPISPAFLHRYPSPQHAAALGKKRMAAFLTKHGYSGRRPATELLARLRSAPAGTTSPVVADAVRDAVLAQVHQLEALNTAIGDLDGSVAAHLAEHPDGQVFTSLPHAGIIYRRARAGGKDHPHDVRILARAWVRVIWRYSIDHQPYDLARQGGAAPATNHPIAA